MSSAHSHHEHRHADHHTHHHADAPHNPAHQAAVPAVSAVPAELLNSVADWTSTFKVMSDPTRLKLLTAMHHLGPSVATVSELAQVAGVSTQTASAALNHMATAGVLTSTRTGREIRYALRHDEVHRILHFIGAGHGEHHHD